MAWFASRRREQVRSILEKPHSDLTILNEKVPPLADLSAFPMPLNESPAPPPEAIERYVRESVLEELKKLKWLNVTADHVANEERL